MPLVTALSMIDTASRTSAVASFDLSSTADRAFFTAVRNVAIAARLRARCLIILRFCFSADAILATTILLGRRVVNLPGSRSQAGRGGDGQGAGIRSGSPGILPSNPAGVPTR